MADAKVADVNLFLCHACATLSKQEMSLEGT
ncbi:hypothetical protein BH23CYA1_BH23CYA1_18400 [soil metagenome]